MSINFYDILNVSTNSTLSDIKKSYRNLLKKYHPDQYSGDSEMFELIVSAYNVLSNDKKRKEYDDALKIIEESEYTHQSLKNKSTKYYKAQQTLDSLHETNENVKNKAEKNFKNAFDMLDIKHKYNRKNEQPINESEILNRYNDIKISRKQDDIEDIIEPIPTFVNNDNTFNQNNFNKKWTNTYGTMELIEHKDVPQTWDSICSSINYGSIDNYEDIYDEKEIDGTTEYASINYNGYTSIDSSNMVNNDDHNKLESNYKDIIEQRLKDRDEQTKKLSNMQIVDYNTDPSCGGYSICNKINDNNTLYSLMFDQDDLKKKYDNWMEKNKK